MPESMLFMVGLKALIVNPKGEVLLVRRSDANTQSNAWDIPGGRMEVGESLTDALTREIQEETGMHPSHIGPVVSISTFEAKKLKTQIVRLIFYVRVDTDSISLSDEHKEYIWRTMDEIDAYQFMDEHLKESFLKLRDMQKNNPSVLEQRFIFSDEVWS